MTRKQTRLARTVPRRSIIKFCIIAALVAIAAGTLQWSIARHPSSGANSQFFPDLPDIDLSALTPSARDHVIQQANAQKCSCNCGLTLACCRNRDRSCQTSLKICKTMAKEASTGGS